MTAGAPPRVATVAALGAGRMGRGIATAFAYGGHPAWLVDLKDRTPDELARYEREALDEIGTSLGALAELGALASTEIPAILGRIRFAGREDAPEALAASAFVFEGVPEVMEAKREAFAFASLYASADAVLASTTSTFLVDTLAGFVTRPERFLNAHWLNPAYVIPLVELSPHRGTAPSTVDAMRALLEALGKVPVVCAAAPGYIVPRLQSLVMNEAARMVEEGLATPEDIDKATRFGFGVRYAALGVLEFIDFGGLDILFYASRYLADTLKAPRFEAPAIINDSMRDGRVGLRTGAGFYDYRGTDVESYRRDVLGRLLGVLRQLNAFHAPGAALTRANGG